MEGGARGIINRLFKGAVHYALACAACRPFVQGVHSKA